MSWFEKICSYTSWQDILAVIVQILLTFGLIYALWVMGSWLWLWWTPDWETVFDYLNVKLPSAIVGIVFLCIGTWVYDILSPGDFQKRIASDSMSSAFFMGSCVLGLALILSK